MRFRFTRHSQLSLENSSLQAISQDIYACIFDPKRPLLNKEVFITSTQFTPGSQRLEGIIHGMRHAMEAGILGAVAYNLLLAAQKFSLHEHSQERRHKEIRCVQVGLYLHDSGREHDKEDIFELDSAFNAYYYCIERLGVDKPTACKIAECILNKDWDLGKKYFYLDGNFSYVPIESMREKEPLRLAIHFGDCLEYLRIPKTKFDINCIKIYALYADSHPLIKNSIKKLIRETVKLVDIFRQKIIDKNNICNGPDALADILSDMQSIHMQETVAPVVSYFYEQGNVLTAFKSDKILSPEKSKYHDSIAQAFYNPNLYHFLLLRMLYRPTQLYSRIKTYNFLKHANLLNDSNHAITYLNGKTIIIKHYANVRSRAEHELIKMFRNTPQKQGNDWRSMSIGAPGSLSVGRSGFGILSSHVNVCDIHLIDAWTGFGSKKNTYGKSIETRQKLEATEIPFKLKKVLDHIEHGGNENVDNEIEAKITQADCIVYTFDPSVFWIRRQNNFLEDNPLFALLEAVYLRDIYYVQSGIRLPVYQLSNVYGYCIQKDITAVLVADAFKTLLEIEFQRLCQMKFSCLKFDFLHQSPQVWLESLFKNPRTISLMAYYEDEFRDQITKLITPTIVNQKKRLQQFVSQYQLQHERFINCLDLNIDMIGAKLSLGIEDARYFCVLFCCLIEADSVKFQQIALENEKNKITDILLKKLMLLFDQYPDFFKQQIKFLIENNVISEDLPIAFKMLSFSGVLSDKQIHSHLLKRFETIFVKKVNSILDKNRDADISWGHTTLFQHIFEDNYAHEEYFQYFNDEMKYLFPDFNNRMKSIIKKYFEQDESFFVACEEKKANTALFILNYTKKQTPSFHLGKIHLKSEKRFRIEGVFPLEIVLTNIAFDTTPTREIWIEIAEYLVEENISIQLNVTKPTIHALIYLNNDKIFNILKRLITFKFSLLKYIDLNVFCDAGKVPEVMEKDIDENVKGLWCLKISEDKVLVNIEQKIMYIRRNSMMLRYLVREDSTGAFKELYYDLGKMLFEQASSNLLHITTAVELIACYEYCDANNLLESGDLLQRLKHHALFLARDNPKVFFTENLSLLQDLINKHQNSVKRNLIGLGASIQTDTMKLVLNIINADKSKSQEAILNMRALITSTKSQPYQCMTESSMKVRAQY